MQDTLKQILAIARTSAIVERKKAAAGKGYIVKHITGNRYGAYNASGFQFYLDSEAEVYRAIINL